MPPIREPANCGSFVAFVCHGITIVRIESQRAMSTATPESMAAPMMIAGRFIRTTTNESHGGALCRLR
jgi:hypothetical protein